MTDKLTIGDTNKETELTELFIRAVRALTRFNQIADGIVIAVDADVTFTCTVQVGTGKGAVPYTNVPLRTLIGTQPGDLEVPVINTDCLLVWRSGLNERPQLLWVDQIKIKTLTLQQLKINASQAQGGVEFNGGENGGMPMSPALTTRLNNIENSINDLMQVFSGWTPVAMDGGAALKAAAADWYVNPLTLTQQTDIENPAITQ